MKQDIQQTNFYVIRFTVENSDRLVAIYRAKIFQLSFLEGFGICQTVTAALP